VATVRKMILKLRHVLQRPHMLSGCAFMRFKRLASSLPEIRVCFLVLICGSVLKN